MRFGPVPLGDALGATLAHSLNAAERRLRKGLVLTEGDLADLRAAGFEVVTVASFDADDVEENIAAARLAERLRAPSIRVAEAFTGRVNLYAERAGVLRVDAAWINAVNAVDEGITIATLPDHARVDAGAMIATVKIIPYAVPNAAMQAALALEATAPISVAPFRPLRARIILTRTVGLKDSVVAKGGQVTAQRLEALGVSFPAPVIVAHEPEAIADAIAQAGEDLVLILGGSATSDRADTVPQGVRLAAGQITRFGMPVDPGNLLFLARRGAQQIVGLPGCARSPALNGADWVLERLVAGLEITGADIAAMGVGGLLKEIPTRPQPRQRKRATARVAVVLLAAGQGTRMRGTDKLVETVGGVPLLHVLAERALASRAVSVRVAIPTGHATRRAALGDLPVEIVEVMNAQDGMSASLRAAVSTLQNTEGVIVMLGDMPDITTDLLNRLIARAGTGGGREIARPVLPDGRAGHPVLFGKAHLDALKDLSGDQGARDVIAAAREHLQFVEVGDAGPLTDLDTPEAWAAWRKANADAS